MALPRNVTQPHIHLPLAQFEVRNRLLRLGQNGSLPGDQTKVALDIIDLILVRIGINAGIQNDLRDLRNVVVILVSTTLLQGGNDLFNVMGFK